MNYHGLQPLTVPKTKEVLLSISQSNNKYVDYLVRKIIITASINKKIKDLVEKIKLMKGTAKVLEEKSSTKLMKVETK